MARRSFRVATLAVMALLAVAGSDARADEGAVPPDLGTPPAEQPALADTPATLPAAETAGEAEVGDQGVVGGAPSQDASQELSASEAAVTPQEAAEPQDPSSSSAPSPTAPLSGDQERLVELPAPEGRAGDPPVEPAGQSPPAAPEAPMEATSAPRALAPGGDRSPQALLSGVARELSTLRAEIDELERLVDEGVAAAPSRLIRLRSRLERLAPTLLALEARLEAAGRLSPLAQELLRRVRARLSRARVSASGLIATLRQSGVRGPELRLLLDELRRFRAIGAALAANLGPVPAPSGPGLGSLYLQSQPATAAARPYAVAPAEPPAAASRAGESPAGGGSDAPRPWSPAPMSASAGPGSAFSAAGLASLSVLLIGLAAARLGERLRLSPGRGYMAVFLTPLDCPG